MKIRPTGHFLFKTTFDDYFSPVIFPCYLLAILPLEPYLYNLHAKTINPIHPDSPFCYKSFAISPSGPKWRTPALTPDLKKSWDIINDLKSKGKLLETGDATDLELSSLQAFTVLGDFINILMRYNIAYLGQFAKETFDNMVKCLDALRKVPERLVENETVYSGKTFSMSDFEKVFINGVGKNTEYKSFISTSLDESVAEGFVKLTEKWAGSGEKVAVIQRIKVKSGVYIDDISDWGSNLGILKHSDAEPSIQIQKEVIINPGILQQIGLPIPIIQKDIPLLINGLKAYYIDFTEL